MGCCWVSCLGTCSGKITGEHLITEGIIEGKSVGVSGLPWCREERKFISKRAYTANILCRKHNSDLSPVDDAAIHAFNTLRKMIKIQDQRRALIQERHWAGRFDVHEYVLDGERLERWFLKTLINFEVVGGQGLPILVPSGPPSQPPPELVKIAFGLSRLKHRAGLYLASVEGDSIMAQERVRYTSLVKESEGGDCIGAGEFRFYGLQFFLCLESRGLPTCITRSGVEVSLRHHVAGINVGLNGQQSQRIKFTWPS